jgi:hypothetical protein
MDVPTLGSEVTRCTSPKLSYHCVKRTWVDVVWMGVDMGWLGGGYAEILVVLEGVRDGEGGL